MAREKELYRENLERLDRRFPEHETITFREAADYLGVSTKTISRTFAAVKFAGRVPKTAIAKALCG